MGAHMDETLLQLRANKGGDMSNEYAAKVAIDAYNEESQRMRSYGGRPSEVSANVNDPVNQPKHYTGHPSGVECIQITEHMGFNLGNAMKYIWRCDLKLDAVEDLKKAAWYINREIAKREKAGA